MKKTIKTLALTTAVIGLATVIKRVQENNCYKKSEYKSLDDKTVVSSKNLRTLSQQYL